MKKQVYTLLLPILIMPYVLTAQPVGRFEESAAVDEETKPVHRVPFASMGIPFSWPWPTPAGGR